MGVSPRRWTRRNPPNENFKFFGIEKLPQNFSSAPDRDPESAPPGASLSAGSPHEKAEERPSLTSKHFQLDPGRKRKLGDQILFRSRHIGHLELETIVGGFASRYVYSLETNQLFEFVSLM
eukprot:Cvel_29655.t1-p1 / transcript=Cvel_29655.t1 / gene=Cvel_29655 / organism=Chromera_velia_CCMP2878 / gene_product=hypothetical protein / transcript_product=hypothetical protein / location=Cvel_scaffold4096:1451-1810(-) / protein_length=120 / sequence_SO=supercontig / SO=protein_coding / is_pseudo=false